MNSKPVPPTNATSPNLVFPSAPRGRDTRWLWIILAAQWLLSAGFLANKTLWLDEAYSALMARLPLKDIIPAMAFDAGPPLYYMLLRMWRAVLGESETALRGLSLLAALAASAGIYQLTREAIGRQAALLATLLFAFSPLTMAYAREARQYTLLAALAVGVAWYARRYVTRGGFPYLAGTGLGWLALVYTHNLGWFIALGSGLAVLALPGGKQRFPALLACGALVLILYLPWLPMLAAQWQNTERTIAWVEKAWTPWMLGYTWTGFLPGGALPAYMDLPRFPVWGQIANSLIVGGALLWGVYQAIRINQRFIFFVLILLFVGLGGPYLVSLAGKPIYLAGRTDYGLFPFWCLLAGYGISHVRWKQAPVIFLLLFLPQAAGIDTAYQLREDPRSERDLVLYLDKHAQTGDGILCTGLTRPVLEYYLRNRGFVFFSYPLDMKNHLAHLNESWYLAYVNLHAEAETVLRTAQQTLRPRNRLWVVGSERVLNQPLLARIERSNGANRIQSPRMGLRKLNEPLFLLQVDYAALVPLR
ncbi:MAG: hypothetical protein HPY51_06625 [Candidatus Omnitrophica bacterium]|nr:hypothetical protein [Candidatus Omnitrophota bacterium]